MPTDRAAARLDAARLIGVGVAGLLGQLAVDMPGGYFGAWDTTTTAGRYFVIALVVLVVLAVSLRLRRGRVVPVMAVMLIGRIGPLSLALLLGRSVLDRLSELASVAAAIATGDRQRRATSTHHDELGSVGEQLNAVLDRLAEMEGSTAGRLNQERQLTLALLDELSAPAAIVSLTGAVVASRLSVELTRQVEAAARRLPRPEEWSAGDAPMVVEDRGMTFRPFRASGLRALGWLAMETDAEAS
jgi:methyl-accepting chemotaxis protein